MLKLVYNKAIHFVFSCIIPRKAEVMNNKWNNNDSLSDVLNLIFNMSSTEELGNNDVFDYAVCFSYQQEILTILITPRSYFKIQETAKQPTYITLFITTIRSVTTGRIQLLLHLFEKNATLSSVQFHTCVTS